jgi:hypothetical protein
MANKKKYEVPVSYTFTGHYIITAENKEEALKIVDNSCGMALGTTIQSLRKEITWDFPTEPDVELPDTEYILETEKTIPLFQK